MMKRKLQRRIMVFAGVLLVLLSCLSGCQSEQGVTQKEITDAQTVESIAEPTIEPVGDGVTNKELLEAAESYRDLYERAVSENTLGSLPVTEDIIERLGGLGYTAVDTENQNQVNMTHPELVEQFCSLVENHQDGECTLISVMQNGGLIYYRLRAKAGEVFVSRDVLQWNQDRPEITDEDDYKAYHWQYSDGYLFFDKELPAGYDGAVGFTAVRVQPLDEKCRELNRQYIFPVSYRSNGMFLTDWSEDDFSHFDFDDMFDRLYPYVYGTVTPYEQGVDGMQYLVPAEEYEKVIMTYFHIDQDTLRRYTAYTEQGYEFRTRGFEDSVSSPVIPFPEVVSYANHEDGTITMTVNAVWPQMHLSKAISHEVTVRPMEDGTYQYVSNHMIMTEDSVEPEWYSEKIRN